MVQYDIARGNKVQVEYWKKWIREFSRLKINEIMLYMEDDWHSPQRPYLGRPDTFPIWCSPTVCLSRPWRR